VLIEKYCTWPFAAIFKEFSICASKRNCASLGTEGGTSICFDDVTTALGGPYSIPIAICGIKICRVGNEGLPKSLPRLFIEGRFPIHDDFNIRTTQEELA
jgi:hypothetical protein